MMISYSVDYIHYLINWFFVLEILFLFCFVFCVCVQESSVLFILQSNGLN